MADAAPVTFSERGQGREGSAPPGGIPISSRYSLPEKPTVDETVGLEEGAQPARPDAVHGPRLQVHEDRARHELPTCEEEQDGVRAALLEGNVSSSRAL